MKVMATHPAGTVSRGGATAGSDNAVGQAVRSPRRRQRATCNRLRDDGGTPGLKKCRPSQWSEIGKLRSISRI
jgi:hypothetical protein